MTLAPARDILSAAELYAEGALSMLVLSRQVGETILIGDDVEIVVVGIVAGKVKLGINAPRSVNIKRSELADRVVAENRSSQGLSPEDLPPPVAPPPARPLPPTPAPTPGAPPTASSSS